MSGRPLVILPVREGVLTNGSFEAVAEATAAHPDGARVILVGSQLGTAAGSLAGHVDAVELAELGDFAVGRWAAALEPLVADASFVLLPASPDGRDLAVRLAAAADLAVVSGAMSVSADRAVVTHHGGLVQSVVRPGGPFVATLIAGMRGVEEGDGDAIRSVDLDLDVDLDVGINPARVAQDVRVVEVEPADAATMDLAEAPRIVGGGAGLMGRGVDDDVVGKRFAQLSQVGEAIGASMGATRVVTDAGYVPHSRQIGTTGVVVDPALYLAFGVSGAVQHTAGLGNPEHVISVNIDPHCPMMSMADLAVVTDANATLDELARLLVGPVVESGDARG